MFKRFIMPLFTVLALVGCASKPPSSVSKTTVPLDRVYDSEYMKDSVEKGKLTITRDTGFFYRGCAHDIYLNNKKALNIKNGETITLNLEPKEYLVRLEVSTAICRKADVTTSDEVTLRKGDHKEYRIIVATTNTAQVRLVRMK